MALTLVTSDLIHGLDYSKLTGTIPTWNQNTTGSAATLTTARTIGGVSFNGSAAINLPGVNAAGNQNTSGTAAGLSATLAVGSGGTGVTSVTALKNVLDDETWTFANDATFSGSVTADQGIFDSTANTYAGGSLILRDLNGANPMYLTSVVGSLAISNGGSADHLLISSTGAATFSGGITQSSGTLQIKNASGDSSGLKLYQAGSDVSTISNHYAGDIAFNTANTSQKMIIKNSGNVGIGTTVPQYPLQVKSGTNINFAIAVGVADNTAVRLNAVNDAVTANIPMEFYATKFNFNNGNVGIGTGSTAPQHKLNVQVGTDSRLGVFGNGTYVGIGAVVDNNSAYRAMKLYATDYEFRVGNTPKLTISSGGNVGIGTTSPSADLEIKGSNTYNKIRSYFSGTYTSGFQFSDFNGGIWYDAAADDLFISGGHANSQLIFNAGGSEKMRISSGGQVGILTSPTSSSLSVRYNAGGTDAGESVITATIGDNTTMTSAGITIRNAGNRGNKGNSAGSALFIAEFNDSIAAIIDKNGDVGIGVASPTEKLEVAGAVRVRRKVLGWYQVVVPNNNNYWHVKTSLWAGGSPNGNTHYTMSHLHAELYSYSTAAIREGRQGWHNWSGTQHNIVNTGNIWSNPYTSSDGYVVLVLNTSGTYIGLNIDWSQVYTYTYVDIHVQSASGSSNTTGVY